MNRRGFLTACLAAAIAPTYIKRGNLDGLWVPKADKIITAQASRTADEVAQYMLDQAEMLTNPPFVSDGSIGSMYKTEFTKKLMENFESPRLLPEQVEWHDLVKPPSTIEWVPNDSKETLKGVSNDFVWYDEPGKVDLEQFELSQEQEFTNQMKAAYRDNVFEPGGAFSNGDQFETKLTVEHLDDAIKKIEAAGLTPQAEKYFKSNERNRWNIGDVFQAGNEKYKITGIGNA